MAHSVLCPFCASFTGSAYGVQLHIEERHTDDSPFVTREAETPTPSSSANASRGSRNGESMPGGTWTRCTRPDCGEHVPLCSVDEHLSLHRAAALSAQHSEELSSPPPRTGLPRPRSPPRKPMGNRLSVDAATNPRRSPRKLDNNWKPAAKSPEPRECDRSSSILSFSSRTSSLTPQAGSTVRRHREPRNPIRLGKRELGPYAFEHSMPSKVRNDLLRGARPRQVQRISPNGELYRQTVFENETADLIPLIAHLCARDPDTTATYLCHPCTRHIRKIYCDGNFCGYWNIQLLMTYVQYMNPEGPQELPDVLRIQDTIERAWDNGKCPHGRLETGGVRNTRKWIGTNEALAFFQQINVRVEALCFKHEDEDDGSTAVDGLLDYIEAYFMSGVDVARKHGTSHTTTLAPVYFQRFGHSMSIVGIERRRNGSRNLLVFDSSFATSAPVQRLLVDRNARIAVEDALRVYRRSGPSLTKWNEFEILVPHPGRAARPDSSIEKHS